MLAHFVFTFQGTNLPALPSSAGTPPLPPQFSVSAVEHSGPSERTSWWLLTVNSEREYWGMWKSLCKARLSLQKTGLSGELRWSARDDGDEEIAQGWDDFWNYIAIYYHQKNHNMQLWHDQKVAGILTVKNDVRGFCQPGVPISLLNEFPPVISNQL